jgi:hypothetical protein
MFEYSEKLIAWLDRELPAEVAANLTRHLPACAECRAEVSRYRQMSETVDAYCEAALAAKAERPAKARLPRPAFLTPALAAAAVLLVFSMGLVLRFRPVVFPAPDGVPAIALHTPRVPVPTVEKTPPAAGIAATSPKRASNRRRERRPLPAALWSDPNASGYSDQVAVYIAIPADALFAPGAFPEGVGFVADVNLRPDGSARRLRLEPQLVGFQTKGTRP